MPEEFQGQRQVRRQVGAVSQVQAGDPGAGRRPRGNRPRAERFAGGGRTRTGKLAIEPVAFRSAKLDPVKATLIAAAAVLVVVFAWIGGKHHLFDSAMATAVGLLLISPR